MNNWKKYNKIQQGLKRPPRDSGEYLRQMYGIGMTDGEWKPQQKTGSSRLAVLATAVILTLLITFLILISLLAVNVATAHAAETVDMTIISKIESNGNPRAVSRTGARGEYQIMPCVLKEYNQYHTVKYSWSQMFDRQYNHKVAHWYLSKRIPQLLRYYHKPVTTHNIIVAYNAGIRAVAKGYTPKETRMYLTKYNRLKEASRG